MKQVIVNKLLVTYLDEGRGPVVLFLHGWGDSSKTFSEQIKILSKNYRCVAIDLAGFGKSDPPKDAWKLEDYAEYINQFCSKLDILDNLLAVIGHSNGGAIAIKACAHHDIAPKKLVLLATSGVRPKRTVRNMTTATVAKAGKLLMIAAPKNLRERARKKLYTKIGSDYLVAPHLAETFKLIVSEDILPEARKIVQPTLLIYGTGDLDTPLDTVGLSLQREIKNSDLVSIEGIGHFVQKDASEEVNQLIKQFLEVQK